MEIGVFINDIDRRKEILEELEVFFRNNEIFKVKINPINLNQDEIKNIKTPARLEKVLNQNYVTKAGNLLIAEWKSLEDEVLVTAERTLFISSKVCKFSVYV